MSAASLTVDPGKVRGGTLSVPGDKSISHRALLLSALAEGETRIDGLLESSDCLATVTALRQLGARVRRQAESWQVSGVGGAGLRAPSAAIECGNSGTLMRLLAGVLAGQPFESTLVGDASLSARPMRRIVEPLSRMGAHIEATAAGTPPLHVGGGTVLRGIDYRLPVPSAQLKSAILLAGLHAEGRTRVLEAGPSRDHTERMLNAFGVPLRREENAVVLDGPARLVSPGVIDIPGDLSSAAFFLVLAAINPGCRIVLPGIGINPGRDGVLHLLKRMGARLEIRHRRETRGGEPVGDITVESSSLSGIAIDAAEVARAIDEIPVLLVAAAVARGRTVIRGAGELRVKESDRLAVMAGNLRALGVAVEESGDGLAVQGGQLGGGTVNAAGDHRIAMAFAVAGTVAAGTVTILETHNINTSYPGFPVDARRLGVDLRG